MFLVLGKQTSSVDFQSHDFYLRSLFCLFPIYNAMEYIFNCLQIWKKKKQGINGEWKMTKKFYESVLKKKFSLQHAKVDLGLGIH